MANDVQLQVGNLGCDVFLGLTDDGATLAPVRDACGRLLSGGGALTLP